jgi:cellulase/cellobiase CelA1
VVTASYSVRTDWGDGFVADITVHNTSGGPLAWVVDLTFTNDVDIASTNTWDATVERLGPTYRFRATAVLKAGESAQFGFVASKAQTSPSVPSRCVVNTRTCP